MEQPFAVLLGDAVRDVPGAQVLGVRVKGSERLREKLQAYAVQGRGPETVADYLGGRISVDTLEDAELVVAQLRQRGRIVEDDDFVWGAKVEKGGYRARHIQVELPNGMTAEVQLVPREVAEVQSQAHQLYKRARSARSIADREQLLAESQQLFADAWQRFVERVVARPPE